MIAGKPHFLAVIIQLIYTCLDFHPDSIQYPQHCAVNILHMLYYIIQTRAHDEMVIGKTCHVCPRKLSANRVGHTAKQVIALLEAIILIEYLEIGYIKMNECQFPILWQPCLDFLLCPLVKGRHVQKSRQSVSITVHGKNLCFREAVASPVVIFVLIHVHDIHIEYLCPISTMKKMSEIFHISDLPLLCDDAVAHIIMLLLAVEGLGHDIVLYLSQILRMYHAREAVVGMLPELVYILAAKKLYHILVRKIYFLVPCSIVYEKSARKSPRYLVP